MQNIELCLLGRRGERLPRKRRNIPQVLETYTPRLLGMEHSEKPEEIRNRIERMYGPDVSRLELFARRTAKNWCQLGDQVGILD